MLRADPGADSRAIAGDRRLGGCTGEDPPSGVHQVLATLGYGDAIGHEVLGIQRVLRGAGYESEIFVETADRGSSTSPPTIARWSARSRRTTC